MTKTLMKMFTTKGVEKKHQPKKKKFQGTQVYSAIIGKSNILNKLSK